MSKQAEAAAMAICGHSEPSMYVRTYQQIIETAYSDRERAVAELLREAKEALWLCQSHGLTMDELQAAINAVEAKDDSTR